MKLQTIGYGEVEVRNCMIPDDFKGYDEGVDIYDEDGTLLAELIGYDEDSIADELEEDENYLDELIDENLI